MKLSEIKERLHKLFKGLKNLLYWERFRLLTIKPRTFIFLFLNVLFMWITLGGKFSNLIFSIIYNFILLNIAVSKWAEDFITKLRDARHIATSTEKDRLYTLLNEVLKKANMQDKGIKLMLIDSISVNAMAIGRRTIILNRGLLEIMSDEQVEGIIAHELGHIHKLDGQINLLVNVMSIWFLVLFYIAIIIFALFENIFMNSFIGNIFAGARKLFIAITNAIDYIFYAIIAGNKRANEYRADEFATLSGYREELISALYILYKMELTDKKELIVRMQADHPRLAYRIERLEKSSQ